MGEKKEGIVKVSDKSVSKYIRACNYCFSKFGFVKVRGLGRTEDKVLEIHSVLEDMDNVEIKRMSGIEVDGMAGLEVVAEKVEGSRE